MEFKKICVFCSSSPDIDNEYLLAGEHLGETIAKKGLTLVYGAGKYGIMGAVARGAQKQNGYVIGVVPTFFEDNGVVLHNCSKIIYTETMRERKGIMESKADAFIVMPGGIGTFEELYEIVTLKQLQRHLKPIIIYNYNNFYGKTLDVLRDIVDKNFVSEKVFDLFSIANSEDQIFEKLENYVPKVYEKFTH